MAKKLTVNIRCNIAAPYGFKKSAKEINDLLSKYFSSRGKLEVVTTGSKYILTSYRFDSGTCAEVKIKVEISKDGNIQAFDTLGTFDTFRKYTVENINKYRVLIKGFIKYLNELKFAWYVSVFVFRVYPIEFMRHFTSRVGDMVDNVWINMRMKTGDYCIIKNDRLEYCSAEWETDAIEVILNIIKKYTRK